MSQDPPQPMSKADQLRNLLAKHKAKKQAVIVGNHNLRKASENLLKKGTKTKSAAQIAQQRAEQKEWNERHKR